MNLNRVRACKASLPSIHRILTLILVVSGLGATASAQEVALQVDSSKSTVKFTLGDALRLVPASGTISGEIVVDAKSGESGSGMRDRKMHKEILESDRYPEISFRPAMVEGATATGKFSARVRGMFSIHGVDREITVPAEVDIEPDHWSASVHFTVPYEKWGMKNPSTMFLRVSDSVEIDLAAVGSVGR